MQNSNYWQSGGHDNKTIVVTGLQGHLGKQCFSLNGATLNKES